MTQPELTLDAEEQHQRSDCHSILRYVVMLCEVTRHYITMLLGTQHWKRRLALTAVVNSTTTRFVLYKLYDNRRQCRWLMLWYKICKYCALAEEGSRNQTLYQTGTDHPNLPSKLSFRPCSTLAKQPSALPRTIQKVTQTLNPRFEMQHQTTHGAHQEHR